MTLSLGDRARHLRLRFRWWEYWSYTDLEQAGLRELSSPNWWGQQKVSQWLGQICSGDAADTSEIIRQAVQDPRRLRQKETDVSEVWMFFLFFESQVMDAPLQLFYLLCEGRIWNDINEETIFIMDGSGVADYKVSILSVHSFLTLYKSSVTVYCLIIRANTVTSHVACCQVTVKPWQ